MRCGAWWQRTILITSLSLFFRHLWLLVLVKITALFQVKMLTDWSTSLQATNIGNSCQGKHPISLSILLLWLNYVTEIHWSCWTESINHRGSVIATAIAFLSSFSLPGLQSLLLHSHSFRCCCTLIKNFTIIEIKCTQFFPPIMSDKLTLT